MLHLSELFHVFDYVLIVLTSVINYAILLIRINKYIRFLYMTGLHKTFIVAVIFRRMPFRLTQRYSPSSTSITSKNLMVSLFLEDRASRLADPQARNVGSYDVQDGRITYNAGQQMSSIEYKLVSHASFLDNQKFHADV